MSSMNRQLAQGKALVTKILRSLSLRESASITIINVKLNGIEPYDTQTQIG